MNQAESIQTGRPLWHLVKARLLEFVRQPEAVFWVYLFPILMVVVLGIAFRTTPVETFDVVIVAGQRAESICGLLAAASSESQKFDARILPPDQAATLLRTGKTSLVVEAAQDTIIYRYDPARPGSLATKAAVDEQLQIDAGRTNPLKTDSVQSTEPGGRYIDFLVPGLLGMGLMGGGLFGVGFAIVDLRIRKLLKLFLATPMKRTDFLLSLMLSRMVFLVPEVIVLLFVSWLLFGVSVFGSWWTIILLILLGSVQFSGIGLLIASRVKTLEAASGLMNLAMLPMWTLCGVFFSNERFPEVVQPFIKLLPLTPLIDALRGVMLEGTALNELGLEIGLIVGWSIASFAIALWIFRWGD